MRPVRQPASIDTGGDVTRRELFRGNVRANIGSDRQIIRLAHGLALRLDLPRHVRCHRGQVSQLDAPVQINDLIRQATLGGHQ